MDRMDFIQGTTRTKVLEKRLLSRVRIDRMVDAKDAEEAFKMLGETEYTSVLANITRAEDYEKALSAELERVYTLMREISKEQIIVDLMALKYDYHNLKVMIKEKELNKDLSHLYIPIGITDYKNVKSAFLAGDLRDLDPEIREAINAATLDYETNKDPQRIDLILDNYYFNHLYKLAKKTEVKLFIEYVEDLIDFTNIKTLIRLKRQGKDLKFLKEAILSNGNVDKDLIILSLNESIDTIINKFRNYRIGPGLKIGLENYRQTEKLSELEKYVDNYLMNMNLPSKYVVFGPEPIFSYLIAKEAEIRVLRIVMVSKLNKLAPDAIRERLRDLYV